MATQMQKVVTSDVKGDRGKDVTSWQLVARFDASDTGAEKIIAALDRLGLSNLVSLTEGRPAIGTKSSSENANAVRQWAREQGMPVSNRGRISFEIHNAYEVAHNGN